MKWYFTDTGFNDGQFNMQFDIELTKRIKNDECILRLYRWKPYCISLGANQNLSEINFDKAKADGIDVVKRPTGGRAIFHSEELTYSVVFPLSLKYSVREIYNQINLALKKGLEIFNSKLKNIELENRQVDFKNFYKKDISSICFAVSSTYEINYDGKKLVGSAQRKIGNLVLQHGSILIGDYHLKIVDYLNLESNRLQEILTELKDTTIDLKNIIKEDIDISYLSKSIKDGFEEVLECYHIAGEEDFILKVMANSIKDVESFLLKKLTKIPGVSKVNTKFVLSTVKYETKIKID